jgi:hypothetical protein
MAQDDQLKDFCELLSEAYDSVIAEMDYLEEGSWTRDQTRRLTYLKDLSDRIQKSLGEFLDVIEEEK